MKELQNISINWFNNYVSSFKELTDKQKRNFEIKKEHSLRVADNMIILAEKLELSEEQRQIAFLVGLFHDIGRFKQLAEFDTKDYA